MENSLSRFLAILMETINPATGEVFATVAACNSKDVDAAVIIAQKAFDDGEWSKKHPNERKAIIIKLADLIEENQHELAVLESLESGKPITRMSVNRCTRNRSIH